jgi:hypothetical protein
VSAGVQSITQLISVADLSVLMDAALRASSRRELRELAGDGLSPPSASGRYGAVKVFWQWYLNGDIPADEPSVLAWHAFSDPQVRREVLHIERCRHLGLLDGFVRDILYPRLGRGPFSLFGEEMNDFPSADLNVYVSERLPAVADRTRHVTREKLRWLLAEAGLIHRSGTEFRGTWRYDYYRPTWQAWLYGLYQEFGDDGHRQRSERYVVEESFSTRRLLLRPTGVAVLLAEGVRRGVLEMQFFGGERYARLTYPDTATMVRGLAAG